MDGVEIMIKVDHLSKQYDGKTVLNDLNFQIHEGDIFGIIGRSGSGKTTLLDCISGLKNFDEGSIFIDGENIGLLNLKDARAVRKEIGFVFQNFSLLSRRNVIQNIALPLKCWGYDDAEIQERTNRLAEMVGLEDHVTKRPKELSGGQK